MQVLDLWILYRKIPTTDFKYFYDRGDLPLMVDFSGAQRKV